MKPEEKPNLCDCGRHLPCRHCEEMPVERAETPVEQRQIASDGGDSARGLEAARSEICAFLEELRTEADECAKFAQSATLRTDREWHAGAAMAYNQVWRKLKEATEKL